MFWIGDKELILIQNSSSLGRMNDNPIYLIILDSSEREKERERDKEGFNGLEKIFLIVTAISQTRGTIVTTKLIRSQRPRIKYFSK
jgi:hypothetical protein